MFKPYPCESFDYKPVSPAPVNKWEAYDAWADLEMSELLTIQECGYTGWEIVSHVR
jgi:hypothetical protein